MGILYLMLMFHPMIKDSGNNYYNHFCSDRKTIIAIGDNWNAVGLEMMKSCIEMEPGVERSLRYRQSAMALKVSHDIFVRIIESNPNDNVVSEKILLLKKFIHYSGHRYVLDD